MIGPAKRIVADGYYYNDTRWSREHLFIRQTSSHLVIFDNPNRDRYKARYSLARRPIIHINVTRLASRAMQNGNANTYHCSLPAVLQGMSKVNGVMNVERKDEILPN